jgi:hypothetical protein
MKDTEFLEMIVKEIVQFPEMVKTTRSIDSRGVLIVLSVDPADMGAVIGRAGIIINAIRLLMKIIGFKTKSSISVKIDEPNKQSL